MYFAYQKFQVGILILKLLDERNETMTAKEIVETITVGAAGIVILNDDTILKIIGNLYDEQYIMLQLTEDYFITGAGRKYLLTELAEIKSQRR